MERWENQQDLWNTTERKLQPLSQRSVSGILMSSIYLSQKKNAVSRVQDVWTAECRSASPAWN